MEKSRFYYHQKPTVEDFNDFLDLVEKEEANKGRTFFEEGILEGSGEPGLAPFSFIIDFARRRVLITGGTAFKDGKIIRIPLGERKTFIPPSVIEPEYSIYNDSSGNNEILLSDTNFPNREAFFYIRHIYIQKETKTIEGSSKVVKVQDGYEIIPKPSKIEREDEIYLGKVFWTEREFYVSYDERKFLKLKTELVKKEKIIEEIYKSLDSFTLNGIVSERPDCLLPLPISAEADYISIIQLQENDLLLLNGKGITKIFPETLSFYDPATGFFDTGFYAIVIDENGKASLYTLHTITGAWKTAARTFNLYDSLQSLPPNLFVLGVVIWEKGGKDIYYPLFDPTINDFPYLRVLDLRKFRVLNRKTIQDEFLPFFEYLPLGGSFRLYEKVEAGVPTFYMDLSIAIFDPKDEVKTFKVERYDTITEEWQDLLDISL